ncbi:MAG TPA: hypothetical protein VEZ89_01885 [Rubrivivax sp.]|nr:hypothetical protein [Rubrivivax sp.]
MKAYQQHRFERTYADLLVSPRYEGAARFFLDELYGPADYTERDAQFMRVVPALVRLFPQAIVETVQTLVSLHALSESLDTAMGQALAHPMLDAAHYHRAWLATGQAEARERQIGLLVALGTELERLTRKPLLRHSLRMMRAPARAAGLDQLQVLLENGFDTFHAMRGAGQFLATIAGRERALAAALFSSPSLDALEPTYRAQLP